MLSIKKIWTITRYEIKTLLRSWFFRIFAGLVFVVLTFLNIVLFAQAFETMPWQFRGMPGSIPYFNMIILNIAQAAIAIFLASDFLKRDKKMNTTEVIYMRSMSNADYIFGKVLGVFSVFFLFDFLILFVSALINLLFTDVPFQLLPYLNYFIIMSLPTLVFMFGFTFFIMSVLRNQAITFLVLLGYIAISLIFLNFKYNAAFDVVTFFLPLGYSDFTGFADVSMILMQRSIYLLLGFAFIFTTILLFKRLPQSKTIQTLSLVMSIVLFVASITLFVTYISHAKSIDKMQTKMRELNDNVADVPVVKVKNYNIEFTHLGEKLKADVYLTAVNETAQPISKLLFSLNPGLFLEKLSVNEKDVPFVRNIHLIEVQLENPLNVDESVNVGFQYSGDIDDRAAYLNTLTEEKQKQHSLMLYKLGKKYHFLTPSYVLLTKENLWYPVPGKTQGTALESKSQKQFSKYSLTVKTNENLTVLSQGKSEKKDGMTRFSPETPQSQISLVIGQYVQRSIQVDSVDYNLYTLNEHNYFTSQITSLGDSLRILIKESKDDYQNKLDIFYPFARFSLVEVPIHYFSYDRPLTFHREYVQPEQVFIAENGAPISAADFKMTINFSNRFGRERQVQMSETEKQFRAVQRFIQSELLGTQQGRFFGPQNEVEDIYNVFPNFYYFTNALTSKDFPIIDGVLELYLKEKAEAQAFNFMRFRDAITDEEKANLLLKEKSMKDILSDPEQLEMANQVLKAKSIYFFRLLESQIGKDEMATFLTDILKNHLFDNITMDEFAQFLYDKYKFDLKSQLTTWYEENRIPGYYITNVQNYQVVDGDRTKYQVKFNIYNPEPVDGVVYMDFMVRGGGRGFGPGGGPSTSDYARSIFVPAETSKNIAVLLDEQARGLTLNTLVSLNLPNSSMRRFEEYEKNEKAKPEEGETILTSPPELKLPGEIIVDNEDEGFKLEQKKEQSFLKKLLKISEKEDEYIALRPWGLPGHWVKSANSMFYGDYIQSAHFTRAGDGDKSVAWEAELSESGQYEIYCYGERFPRFGRRGPDEGDFIKEFHFKVFHDDGADEVIWDSESAEGWNYLGTYYLSEGTVKVELSNKSEGQLVIADAIKWIKK